MSDLSRYILIAFGGLFFLGHVAGMFYSLSYARSRDDRLGYIGICVPGLAGLPIAASALVASPVLALVLLLLALPFMWFGRAAYELVVFRPKRDP